MPDQSTPPTSRRPYRLDRRLESVDETRRRITAAAFELHASIGPSRTTIRAIAARAGVQRHTVYAHFPDLETLYVACTEHGIRVTGMPVAEPWAAISDPATRLRHGLREVFAWYRSNEGMLRNVLYDIDPTAPPPTQPDLFEIRMGTLFDTLAEGWTVTTPEDRPTLLVVLAHTVAFETWRSLTAGGLTDSQVVDLLASIVDGVATGRIAVRG